MDVSSIPMVSVAPVSVPVASPVVDVASAVNNVDVAQPVASMNTITPLLSPVVVGFLASQIESLKTNNQSMENQLVNAQTGNILQNYNQTMMNGLIIKSNLG